MPLIEHAEGFARYLATDQGPPEYGHEAGFDAFMTGVAFVGLAKVLEVRREAPELADNQLFRRRVGGLMSRPEGPHLGSDWAGHGGGEGTKMVNKGRAEESRRSALSGTSGHPEMVTAVIYVPGLADGTLPLSAEPGVPSSMVPTYVPGPLESSLESPCNRPLEADAQESVSEDPGSPSERDTAAGAPSVDQVEEQAQLRNLLERTSGSSLSFGAVQKYAYRINLMSSDMPHLPLKGPLIVPERNHVFHLSGFSEETRAPEIAGRFAELGLGYVDITWIDQHNAFVALRSRTLADSVVDAIAGSGWGVKIMRWADFRLQAQSSNHGLRRERRERKTKGWTGTAADSESQPRKGRKLNDGEKGASPEDEGDAEQDGQRVHKSRVCQTCVIL